MRSELRSTEQGQQAADFRRALPRSAWLSNRARNALQRPVFIVAISVSTFVIAIVSLVVGPRTAREQAVTIPTAPRPDTLGVIADAAQARTRVAEADSAIAAIRMDFAAAAAADSLRALDTLTGVRDRQRDSLQVRLEAMQRALARAQQAPLASSYRALAAVPELQTDPRVHALVDSLAEAERERDIFGAVGGVDPIFVALTTRANEYGRALQTIAAERARSMQTELDALGPAIPRIADLPVEDSTRYVAVRDSARMALSRADSLLTTRRAVARELDLEEERARDRAAAVAPPLALLGSAFILSAVFGFGAALFGELRRPRVSNASELERLLGVRVLSVVERPIPSADRGRREADRAAPPYFDPSAEGYQLAYLGLATDHSAEMMATVTGDEPSITAVVGCNLSAVAAEEARATLVVDLDPSCSASAALRTRVSPGITDILSEQATWPDASVAAAVGRDKSVDLVPHGISGRPTAPDVVALLEGNSRRLVRYYDAVFLLAPVATVASDLPKALPSPEVLYCARQGLTPLRRLRDDLRAIRAAGGLVRGIILWDAPRPILPALREAAGRTARRQSVEHENDRFAVAAK